MLARLGRKRRVVASLTSFLVAPALVAESEMICTVPARLARRSSGALNVLAPPCEVGAFSVHMGYPRRGWRPGNRNGCVTRCWPRRTMCTRHAVRPETMQQMPANALTRYWKGIDRSLRSDIAIR